MSKKIPPSTFIPTSLFINSGTVAPPPRLFQPPREMRVLILELLSILHNFLMLSKDLQLQNWYFIIEQALRSVQLIQKPPIHLFLLHSFLGLKWVSVLKESEKKIDRDFDTWARADHLWTRLSCLPLQSIYNSDILTRSQKFEKKITFFLTLLSTPIPCIAPISVFEKKMLYPKIALVGLYWWFN